MVHQKSCGTAEQNLNQIATNFSHKKDTLAGLAGAELLKGDTASTFSPIVVCLIHADFQDSIVGACFPLLCIYQDLPCPHHTCCGLRGLGSVHARMLARVGMRACSEQGRLQECWRSARTLALVRGFLGRAQSAGRGDCSLKQKALLSRYSLWRAVSHNRHDARS